MENNQKIAIVGIGCRYGNRVDSVKQFWKMLVEGLDCTTPIPPDRFDASYFLSPGEKTAGKLYIQNGGYISLDPYMFDRQFFKMPPDEAAHLDPQVRLLLEVTWEALENAGIPASSLRGSKTGVYMGVTAQEYGLFASTPYHNMNQYSNSGTNSCMVSNRISYEFDLRGPSFSVDTACSSSLYSIHLACEALKQKSCPIALAGGVNLILMPTATIGFCQAGMLSGDGKCKSFDQAADGYSRSEGAGIVVLKLLSDALKDGDRIYAVIRGGALSNDGRTPGIANPSYEAQVDLVKSACRNARVHPSEIVYAEAHGTGTRVGDKTEAGALGEVMGRHRGPQHPPLYIGSVKSNLGHTEGAAGVAGIIKVALSLHQRQIPRVVHFQAPNDNLDFEALQIHIPKTLTRWPIEDKHSLACCSSFGFGGANANLVLEGSQPASNGFKNLTDQDDILSCLLLSAANQETLHKRIKDWKKYLMDDTDNSNKNGFNAALYTAAFRSHHHAHRIGFIVRSREDALEQLQHKLENVPRKTARYVEGIASATSDTKQQIVFVFSGMGTQWWGMARELMRTQPVFASKITEIDAILEKYGAKWSLTNLLSLEKCQKKINRTEISQPCLCAVAIGLVHLWRQRGLVPNAVVGHSVGEVAAAYAAGLLSLEQTIQLIYRRGRELQKTSGSGKMVAVLHRVEDALQLAKNSKYGKLLDVAAINSPGQVVFSGDSSSVDGFVNDLKSDNVKCVVLKVDNAFHSRQQDTVKKPFIHKVGKFLRTEKVAGKSKTLPMMSTVTGRYLTVEEANSPEYWFQNVREQVSFMATIQKLVKDGFRNFVEIGPHPSLLPALRETFTEFHDADGKFISTGSLVRPQDTSKIAADSENLLMSQMKLHVNGIKVDFRNLFKPAFRRVVSIPNYPWQRERCSNITQNGRKDFLFPIEEGAHLLLGEHRQTFYLKESSVKIWRANLDASTVPWVKDHVLQGAVVVPAAAYIETALAAAKFLFNNRYPMVLTGLMFDRFMFAPDCEGCLETTVEEKTSDEHLFTLRSHEASTKKWTQHCHLNITRSMDEVTRLTTSNNTLDVASISERCVRSLSGEDFFDKARKCGFKLGPTFRGVQSFTVSEDYQEGLVYAEAPPSVKREFHRYVYHPAFMDSILQSVAVVLLLEAAKQNGGQSLSTYRVPKSIKTAILHQVAIPMRAILHVKVDVTNQLSSCDIDAADADTNEVFFTVKGLAFESIQSDKLEHEVWSMSWKNTGSLKITEKQPSAQLGKRVVFLPDDSDVSTSLVRLLKEDGVDVYVIDSEGDTTQNVITALSDRNDPDILMIVMKTDASLIGFVSESIVSQAQFEKCQDEGPLSYSAVFKALTQKSSVVVPRVLLFVKEGFHVTEGEDVNPFMAVLSAVGMTMEHEESSICQNTIDLPVTANSEECAKIARDIIYRTETVLHEENILAIRGFQTQDVVESDWEMLCPRLKIDYISKIVGSVPTTQWSVNSKSASDRHRTFAQKSYERIDGDKVEVDHTLVKIEYFSMYTRQSDENGSAPFLCVYVGSTEAVGRVVGYQKCDRVLPIMQPNYQDVIEIPSYIKSEDAISIMQEYLPSAVFFSQALSVSPGILIVLKVDSIDSSIVAVNIVATFYGAETVVLEEDHGERHREADLGVGVRCLNDIEDSSIDVLFLSVGSSALGRSLSSLLPKLKRNATVVIMHRQKHVTNTVIKMLPANMKMVFFESHFSSVLDFLTSSEIAQVLSNLWKMFDPNATNHFKRTLEKHKELSFLAASNTPIPEEEVIRVKGDEVLLPLSLKRDGFIADEGSAYFITGGTNGFGLKLLEWLVARGARYIYTGSRRPMNDEIQEVVQQAATVGANVQHIQMDISNATDVERELKKMQKGSDNWPTLKCIFHCAAVYSDGFLYNLTTESWNSVMAPKAYGALLLHQVTEKLGIKLDRFIMISSIVSLIGNAGQGSYCSANVFLNALSHYRHTRGLAATVLQIGVINNSGFAVRQDLVQTWEENGVRSITAGEALGAIGCALYQNIPEFGISGYFNRKLYADRHRALMTQHFKEFQGTKSLMKGVFCDKDIYLTSNNSIRQVIQGLPIAEARERVMDILAKLLSEQLGLSDAIPYDSAPINLGLDSLMAFEFSQMIHQQFEVNVSAVDLLNDKNTIQQLAKTIVTDLMSMTDSGEGSKQGERALVSKAVVVLGEEPVVLAMKFVCFPSTGAGPLLYASWIRHLIQYGVQVLMIQLPGWEGRDDELHLTNMSDITRIIRDELVTKLLGTPFVFFGHSMGSLIAFEVAHLLMAEDDMSPKHLFVSSWYAPTAPYPHPEELKVSASTFEALKKTLQLEPRVFGNVIKRENVQFSFMDKSAISNVALMRRMVPCIQAAIEILKEYSCKPRQPLLCGINVFGGKHDNFVSSELLDGWELMKSKKYPFKKTIFPGKHMYILTNTEALLKEICLSCKNLGIKGKPEQ